MPYHNQALRYIDFLNNIMKNGRVVKPRGFEIREIEDHQLRIDPDFPFMTFRARKYDPEYFKKEMRWKLGASKYDDSIKAAAKMWSNVQNPDGTFNSNYGQYWFGEQMGIWNVVMELTRDHDSRRAIIPMLTPAHMTPQTKDTVCTEGVSFRIRDNMLNMSVHMRSSDVVYGLGTDIPTFSFLYRLVLGILWTSISKQIKPGEIIVTAMSSHIYSTHYDMVTQIIDEGVLAYQNVQMPYCCTCEAMNIIARRGKLPENPEQSHTLERWLHNLPAVKEDDHGGTRVFGRGSEGSHGIGDRAS